LATKHTNKKQNYDKKLLEKLDTVTTKVASKNFYTFAKNAQGFFSLIDYKRDLIIINNIPTEPLAEKMCKRYNAGKYYNYHVKHRLINLMDYYSKLYYDSLYYERTISESKDEVLRSTAMFRQQIAQERMKKTVRDLRALI